MAQTGPKNIVICCDGTGNEFGDANSNVVKLYTALAIDDEQVGYYHPGVGTMGDPAERHRLGRWWSQIKGLAFASGFKDNIFDAYRYLMEIYNDGDKVCLFGFSRGAYTVRALAGLLSGYGLLCPGSEGHLPYAWRMYVDQHQDRTRHSIDHSKDSGAAFKETFSRKDFKIHFIGIWDTVSSVGWITQPLRLFNVAQNAIILHGRHAISIDERRCFYHDNLWGDPLPEQDIVQVWFAGVHSDVGGSYPQSESVLSNITLKWMLGEADAAGIRLVQDRVAMVLGNPSSSYPAARPLYAKPTSSIVHRSLYGFFWWLLEFFPHVYYDKDYGREHYRVPLGARRQLPGGALVHHTVKERMDDKSRAYSPANISCGALTPLTALLYKYQPPSNTRSNTVGRWAVMILFSLLDLIVALGILLLVVRLSPRLGTFVLHLCGRLLHWISIGYSDLSGWVMSHLGSTIHKIFFTK
ncbi:MAG TPA: DUF2235 domain-containing protein [Bryobacteraceae bacterium]|jgi:hypothetical protein